MAVFMESMPKGAIPSATLSTFAPANTVEHEWKISDFNVQDLENATVGSSWTSNSFFLNGNEFALVVHPNGRTSQSRYHLSAGILLKTATPESDQPECFHLALCAMDKSGVAKVTWPRTGLHRVQVPVGSVTGPSKFLRHDLLSRHKDILFPLGVLYLKCWVQQRVCQLEPLLPADPPPSIAPPLPTIGSDFGALLESGAGSDVTIRVGPELFPAHRIILAARSPVLRAMLSGCFKELNSVEIEDVEPRIFGALLTFFYTDEVPELTLEAAQHLLAAADRFDVPRLRGICETKLCSSLTIERAADTLTLAHEHGADKLKAACLEYVAAHLLEVMATEAWGHLCEASLQGEVLEAVAAATRETKSKSRKREADQVENGGERSVRPRLELPD